VNPALARLLTPRNFAMAALVLALLVLPTERDWGAWAGNGVIVILAFTWAIGKGWSLPARLTFVAIPITGIAATEWIRWDGYLDILVRGLAIASSVWAWAWLKDRQSERQTASN
jgi:hypothetical protein